MQKQKTNLILKPPTPNPLKSYKKLNLQGKGNYGHVYMAEHKETNQLVAIKRVKKVVNSHEGLCASFIREISILKKIQHPNVVRMLDYYVGQGEDGFFVLEWLGSDLEREIAKGRIGVAKTRHILRQVLQAVWHCHRHNIMHRDIKPSNILYNPQTDTPKLADFGISKQLHKNPKTNTTKISALFYRAPQLLLQDQHSTQAIDLWSVGCLFAQCVLGRVLFQAEFGSQMEQIWVVLRGLGVGDGLYGLGLGDVREKLRERQQRPVEESIPELKDLLPPSGLDLLNRLLCLDPKRRITAGQALSHQFFTQPKQEMIDEPRISSSNQNLPIQNDKI